jgi:hypothetical protein
VGNRLGAELSVARGNERSARVPGVLQEQLVYPDARPENSRYVYSVSFVKLGIFLLPDLRAYKEAKRSVRSRLSPSGTFDQAGSHLPGTLFRKLSIYLTEAEFHSSARTAYK